MTLACRQYNTHNEGPWLVWLHGLLGDSHEWETVIKACHEYPSLVIDLPRHGNSASIGVNNFVEMSALLHDTLKEYDINHYWLIGYSLGGRIAMYHACFGETSGLMGLIVEGGNPGLYDAIERQNRIAHDKRWAARFRNEPINDVLTQWYQQPVFADLSDEKRQLLVKKRSSNAGFCIAESLETLSLGHQPWLVAELQQLTLPFIWLCGEQDKKFQSIAQQYSLPLTTIPQAGHNAHQAQPDAYAAVINHVLSLFG
ncbi:2-succinyl-6-hydroxy-2,4-cyclohexadiene-1-carboxylate synthase [Proteus mirabilis]|uniref:2-succinyl-6-hydroxy-2, 4-cyclohexadiene-1-carboxylate synthase n=1 Tax=Proteus mirabilis TaxID=584 RepID=UPI001A287173|nr:2-succinyl-6-hydroxy-2,4-cyclohexadiene-1-carboxylate synthase [Proteus mirabilis]MBI6278905.1 2-succinyl-6-hydroxy-2,4-cyclohexadiene-1-carboxylate synthase [Proteus mirabilis]MEC3989797.1 2-succinyl-6-hydroxy-2,4-cyclohexadiene-1-carboxylate synthase [Proteus mirabilis]MEC4038873.1 2-succinyl-6-hydroxy-2,4-cyclohexadiene-1-carboxylate synthase [Proteus mirabilis]MEC4066265.1 2-succinyl-6-hydroxy-2,4-cyclohexadiene-1-carboxylate synthase [Proteus mirabilis]MEC4096424.1 2-succinyl-6-hydroxy